MIEYEKNDSIESKEMDINLEWINNFEETDKLYADFYKENLYYINVKVIYIDRENNIDKIKQESILLSKPNYLTEEEVLQILKKNSIDNGKRYSLLSILQYNYTLEPEEIKNYLTQNYSDDYLKVIKNIDTIVFERTISMFHDLNDIILIFYEKSQELKKISNTNMTKKIFLRPLSSNKKTIKKRYKD